MSGQIKINRPKFAIVSTEILFDKSLSLKAKGLYSYLYAIEGERITILSLSKQLKEGKDAIMSAIDELVDAGYCRKEQMRSDGMFGEMLYEFFTEKQAEITENEQPKEEPSADSPYAGFPYAENHNIIYNSNNNIILDNNKNIDNKEKEINKEKEFLAKIDENSQDYPDDLVRRFKDYWTEKNKKGKMRFEAEKFFDIKKRLKTFQQNAEKWQKSGYKPKTNNSYSDDIWND